MKIRTKDIKEDGFEINITEDRLLKKLIEEATHPTAACSKAALNLYLARIGENFDMSGSIRYHVELTCDKCLETYKMTSDLPIHMILSPHTAQSEEDDNISYFKKDVIDVDEILREQVLLAQPIVRLCEEDCKGLCPECGKNLNKGRCECNNQ